MKKQAKKAKGKGSKSQNSAGPVAALYNLDAGTERGDAVRATLGAHGVRMKTVTADMLGNPVGAIVGMPGFRLSAKPYDGQAPATEFMLLHNMTNQRLNELLAVMREANCSVGCKAQVTQHNRLWPFATLIAEVSREHEVLSQL